MSTDKDVAAARRRWRTRGRVGGRALFACPRGTQHSACARGSSGTAGHCPLESAGVRLRPAGLSLKPAMIMCSGQTGVPRRPAPAVLRFNCAGHGRTRGPAHGEARPGLRGGTSGPRNRAACSAGRAGYELARQGRLQGHGMRCCSSVPTMRRGRNGRSAKQRPRRSASCARCMCSASTTR